MKGTTHVLFALLFGIAFLHFFPEENILATYIFAVLLIACAELPDFDLKNRNFKHRGFLHSIYLPLIFAVLGFFVWEIFYGAAIGFLSHGISDALTPLGWAPFTPASNSRIRGPIKTGSASELFVAGLVAVIIFYLVI